MDSSRFVPVVVLCLCLASLSLFACAPEPETSKALVKISNVKLWRSDEHTLKVFLDYDLEMGVRLPLPYKEILVAPLEPQVKLVGDLEPFNLSVGSVGVTIPIPTEAGIKWDKLSNEEACCVVSLKGVVEDKATKKVRYERISNEVRVPPPPLSAEVSS